MIRLFLKRCADANLQRVNTYEVHYESRPVCATGFRPPLTFHVGGRALGSKLGLLQPPVDREVDDFCRHVGVQVGRDLLRQSK